MNEDFLTKFIFVWKLSKSEDRVQKEWLRVMSKIGATVLKLHDKNPEISMSLNKKRVLSQILNYLESKIMEAKWNETLSSDTKINNLNDYIGESSFNL